MWKTRTVTALVLILFSAVVSGPVLAAGAPGRGGSPGGGGWHGAPYHYGGPRFSYGIYLGAPWFPYYGPPYYYAPYYYPPAVVAPAYPPAYVEQGAVQAAPPQAQGNWWYYCEDVKNYYPYVRECPGGWVRVPPQPPSD